MKPILTLLLLLFLFSAVSGQELMNKDSLLRLLPVAKEDSNRVLLLINIGQQYESNEPDKAKSYYLLAKQISEKIHYPLGVVKYAANYTFVLNMQGLYDSSILVNLEALKIARTINNPEYLGKTLFNTGTSYRQAGQYEEAVKYYEEGKKIFEQSDNKITEARTGDILQLLYHDMHQYTKAIQYGEKSVKILREVNDSVWLGYALNNLGLNYSALQQSNKSEQLFKEALKIGQLIGDKNMQVSQLLNIGDIAMHKNRYAEARPLFEKALLLSQEIQASESEMIAYKGLSFCYESDKQYDYAKQLALKALNISYQYNLRLERQKLFTHLSNLAYSMQDKQLGEYYATEGTLLGDSLLNETIQKNTLELEKKYETEKKNTQIQLQQSELKRRRIFNYLLSGSALALLLITGLLYRTYKQKQKLQQQRIAELETEKQLTATEAVLKGEEQERTRLAKDLHDGLGGMLSGIKYSMNMMKGNVIMTPENQQAFERSMDMLDSSIKEMRRVAHNMMPEALVKFGLDTALKDFCNDINQTGALNVNYQSIGMEGEEVDQTTAITVYRIVQELINNTMKHAAAKNAIVQLSKENNKLSITVEDDGKGFDTAILQSAKGIGWTNIQNRVEFLKGKLDVNSGEGKGTSVLIEMNV